MRNLLKYGKTGGILLFIILAVIVAGGFFLGTAQQNICHIRVYHSSCEAPVRDMFTIVGALIFFVLLRIFLKRRQSRPNFTAPVMQGILPAGSVQFISRLCNPLIESLRKGILHPKLGESHWRFCSVVSFVVS